MKLTIENITVIIVLILTEAWFLNGLLKGEPDFEPAIAFILACATIFAKDPIKEKLQIGGEANNHDLALFESFQNALPYEPTIRLLNEHDFGNAAYKHPIDILYNFVATWDAVEKEFINKKLEKMKKNLYEAAHDFTNEISGRTVPLGEEGRMISVYSDHQRQEAGPRPSHVLEDAKVLNQKASEFVPKYEEFVRSCRSKLLK